MAFRIPRRKIFVLRRDALPSSAVWTYRSNDRLLSDSAAESADAKRREDYARPRGATGSLVERRRARARGVARWKISGVWTAHSRWNGIVQGAHVWSTNSAVAARFAERRRTVANGPH